MKISLLTGVSGIPVLPIFVCTILVLGFAGPVIAQPTSEEISADTVSPTTVSPGTSTFQGLMPPAGSAVINPIPAKDTTTAPKPVPTATVHYGASKPDGEDTHPTLTLSPDKAELVRLDTDAASVIVGSPDNLNVQLENRRLLVLTPNKPGATYLSILDDQGDVIMQRHVIVASPKANYIRIRRSCSGQSSSCQETSVYYCPGMCHAVGSSSSMPSGAPSSPAASSGGGSSAPSDSGGSSSPPISAGDVPHPTVTVNPVSPVSPGL